MAYLRRLRGSDEDPTVNDYVNEAPFHPFRTMFFTDLEEVLPFVRAAEGLDFGFRFTNRYDKDPEVAPAGMEWILELSLERPVSADEDD